MAGYHTRWVRPPDQADDPERIAIREAQLQCGCWRSARRMVLSLLAAGRCTIAAFTGRRLNELALHRRCV